jgi:hypothetical protein
MVVKYRMGPESRKPTHRTSQNVVKRFSRGGPFVMMPAESDGSQARSRPSDIPAMDSSMSPQKGVTVGVTVCVIGTLVLWVL